MLKTIRMDIADEKMKMWGKELKIHLQQNSKLSILEPP